MNVTVADPRGAGYLTVYPCGEVAPVASNVNFSAGETIPNLTIQVGTSGSVCLLASATADVIVDVTGWQRA